MIEIKRGDAAVIHLELGADISGYTSGKFLMDYLGSDAEPVIVDLGTTFTGSACDVTLSGANTALAGDYDCEVEFRPGPHTWPSKGYLRIRIREDLG